MASHPNIILVDDDPSVRASLAFSLELEGFQIDTYASAEELKSRQEFPDEGCLVLDLKLPGEDGLSLLKSLRGRGIDLPAVLITSAPTKKIRALSDQAGATLVEKPLMCDALSSTVRSRLAERTARLAQ